MLVNVHACGFHFRLLYGLLGGLCGGVSSKSASHVATCRRNRRVLCAPLSSIYSRTTCAHDLSILFLFSLLFKRSTRFLCIFSSIFWKRSRSSLAARLVRIASTRRCPVSNYALDIQFCPHTCRSASFSSFISFSLALTAARAFRSAARFSKED